jgi:hypothetical protein
MKTIKVYGIKRSVIAVPAERLKTISRWVWWYRPVIPNSGGQPGQYIKTPSQK